MRLPSNVFIVALGPMIGISCACVYLLAVAQQSISATNAKSKASLKATSDEELAKKFDFPTVERFLYVKKMETRVMTTGVLTADDLSVVKETFENGRPSARAVVLHTCSYLRNREQIRDIITRSKTLAVDKALHDPLTGMLVGFTHTKSAALVRQLQTDPDPVVARLAKKAVSLSKNSNSTSNSTVGAVSAEPSLATNIKAQ